MHFSSLSNLICHLSLDIHTSNVKGLTFSHFGHQFCYHLSLVYSSLRPICSYLGMCTEQDMF